MNVHERSTVGIGGCLRHPGFDSRSWGSVGMRGGQEDHSRDILDEEEIREAMTRDAERRA